MTNLKMTLNRKLSPEFQTINKIDFIKAEEHQLNNNVPLYSINAGSQDIIKIEFLFSAGSRFQKIPLIAYTTNNLINEGTTKRHSSEIAEILDFYGSYLQLDVNDDFASVTLFSLNKHLENLLPILQEVLMESNFTEDELETFIQNDRQQFIVSNEKVGHLARKHFKELLFGSQHPYGYFVKKEDYEKVNRTSVLDFYENYYKNNGCKIIVAGKVTDKSIDLINAYFGNEKYEIRNKKYEMRNEKYEMRNMKHYFPRKDVVQSAIRVGRVLFNKTHPDYFGMQLLNTVLGGYFGSRLMSNIREDKGYTYSISSGIASLQQAGFFYIGAEVGADICQKALDEIFFELKRLREDLIPEKELEVVRNYLMGVFLRNADGPFALADRFRSILEYNLDYSFYENYIKTILTTTPEELRTLACKYFREEDMVELVVGRK